MLPYPVLTAVLILFWLLLNDFTLGHLILGTVVAIFASWAMTALRPDVPSTRKWHLLIKLFCVVMIDIVKSNAATAWLIIRGHRPGHRSDFVLMPVALEDKTALTLYSIILTSTPGSAWLEYDPRDKTVLMHVLDVADKDRWVDETRARYEKILLEIFG